MTGKAPHKKYFGKHQGTVARNDDPEFRGRIQAIVPDVLQAIPTTWALPCVPLTGLPGLQSGVYVVPAVGASVWMEFEDGDPNRPIWTGCFWGSAAEVPLPALAGSPLTPNMVLQTISQNTIRMGGDPASGISISCGPPTPATPGITITKAGIVITDGIGMITIAGGTVTINKGALIVLP
jgi:hypothetical protein